MSGENTNEIIKNFFGDKLGIEVYDSDIDHTHKLKQKSSQNDGKPRPIIVKLVIHDLKNFIYLNKKKLKGTVVVITESLTAPRLHCLKILKELRKQKKISSFWTIDVNIIFMKENSKTKIWVEDIHKFNSYIANIY